MNVRSAVLIAMWSATALGQEVRAPPEIRSLEDQCRKGNAAACTNVGVIYHEGMTVPRDSVKGVAMFRRACEGGDPRGCSNLGITHVKESLTEAEASVAVRLLERGCSGSDALGCRSLGWMYDHGHGVKEDASRATQLYAKALTLYQRDCGTGDARSCTMVGVSAGEGKGSARDEKRAVEFYQRGCDLRDGLGCKYLRGGLRAGAGHRARQGPGARRPRQGVRGRVHARVPRPAGARPGTVTLSAERSRARRAPLVPAARTFSC